MKQPMMRVGEKCQQSESFEVDFNMHCFINTKLLLKGKFCQECAQPSIPLYINRQLVLVIYLSIYSADDDNAFARTYIVLF